MSPRAIRWGGDGWVRACRVAVGLVLLAAALAKIGDQASFARQIGHYRLLPVGTENLIALTVPWIELLAGLALVLGVRARSGAWLAVAMLGVFTLAVGLAVARGLDIECGCFGTGDGARVGGQKLLENLILLAVAVIASLPLGVRTAEPGMPSGPRPLEAPLAAGGPQRP